jgi:hypothetical protein
VAQTRPNELEFTVVSAVKGEGGADARIRALICVETVGDGRSERVRVMPNLDIAEEEWGAVTPTVGKVITLF